MVPLVGGFAGMIAALLSPWTIPRWGTPLPLVLDLGSLPMVSGALVYTLRKR